MIAFLLIFSLPPFLIIAGHATLPLIAAAAAAIFADAAVAVMLPRF